MLELEPGTSSNRFQRDLHGAGTGCCSMVGSSGWKLDSHTTRVWPFASSILKLPVLSVGRVVEDLLVLGMSVLEGAHPATGSGAASITYR